MRPHWFEDLSALTLEDVVRAREVNRAWYKVLRADINALMDRKLGKHIGSEEYVAGRKIANAEVAEYERRGRILVDEITVRSSQLRLVRS